MDKDITTFIISAASGTGKTTLNRRLVKEFPEIQFSISHTTRPIRPGERDGDHYHFLSDAEFVKLVEQGRMLEWAEVFGNKYGTTLDELARIKGLGKNALLEIDIQGWQQAKSKLTDVISIFILPPSVRHLWQRLENRGTDSIESRLKRILTGRKELEKAVEFQHVIINDDIEKAYQELKKIAIDRKQGSLSHEQGLAHCAALIDEFDRADWLAQLKKSCPNLDV
jgi:guanylate kinase